MMVIFLQQAFAKIADPISTCFVPLQAQQLARGSAVTAAAILSPQPLPFTLPPSADTLQTVAKALATELEAARAIPRLADAVGRQVVARAMRHTVSKAEPLVVLNDPEASQVRDKMTPSQIQNAAVFQTLVTAHAAFTSALLPSRAWLSSSTTACIDEACRAVETLAASCVSRLFSNATKLLESSVYLIHSEDLSGDTLSGSGGGSGDEQQTSAYVTAVDKQLRHFQTQFLARLTPCPLLTSLTTALCSRVLSFFVRHAALVRPLGIRGKLRLAADMAQLELCIGRLLPARTTGDAYKQLRALRPLMHRELNEFVGGDAATQQTPCPEAFILPPSVVMHHLFSRAPSDMQSPHVNARMTLAQYSEWLDKHTETEIWGLIKADLDAYAVRQIYLTCILLTLRLTRERIEYRMQ